MPATLRSLSLTALTVVCLSLLFTSVAIAELQYDPGVAPIRCVEPIYMCST